MWLTLVILDTYTVSHIRYWRQILKFSLNHIVAIIDSVEASHLLSHMIRPPCFHAIRIASIIGKYG